MSKIHGSLVRDDCGLTLMLELSMFSKSSAEMVGTLLTRSIRKRPTLLSAATLPDWDRSNSITFIASIRLSLHYLANDLWRHDWATTRECYSISLEHRDLSDSSLSYDIQPALTHQHVFDVGEHGGQHVLYPGCRAAHLGQVRGQALGTAREDPCPLEEVHCQNHTNMLEHTRTSDSYEMSLINIEC